MRKLLFLALIALLPMVSHDLYIQLYSVGNKGVMDF
jgi:hypothetical protein